MKLREWIQPRKGLGDHMRELMAAMPFDETTREKVLRSMWEQTQSPRELEIYQDAGIRSADELIALYREHATGKTR